MTEMKFLAKAEYTGILTESFGERPTVKFIETKKGETAVCNFQIAMSKNPNTGKLFDWQRVTAWGSKAEIIAAQEVGTWVTVKGFVYNKHYTDKNGEKVYYKDVSLFDGDDSLVIHCEGNTLTEQLTDMGGTVTSTTDTSANEIPF